MKLEFGRQLQCLEGVREPCEIQTTLGNDMDGKTSPAEGKGDGINLKKNIEYIARQAIPFGSQALLTFDTLSQTLKMETLVYSQDVF